jgi:hypothetical protein
LIADLSTERTRLSLPATSLLSEPCPDGSSQLLGLIEALSMARPPMSSSSSLANLQAERLPQHRSVRNCTESALSSVSSKAWAMSRHNPAKQA